MPASEVELEYQRQIAAMTPAERVARSAAMFAWTREQLTRQIIKEEGDMSDERLKWKVALKLYGNEPDVRSMIEKQLAIE